MMIVLVVHKEGSEAPEVICWSLTPGSTTASLSLNKITMPRSDKREAARVVRFIWRERKSLCKLFTRLRTGNARVTSDLLRETKCLF